jgi:hypothetical protein
MRRTTLWGAIVRVVLVLVAGFVAYPRRGLLAASSTEAGRAGTTGPSGAHGRVRGTLWQECVRT